MSIALDNDELNMGFLSASHIAPFITPGGPGYRPSATEPCPGKHLHQMMDAGVSHVMPRACCDPWVNAERLKPSYDTREQLPSSLARMARKAKRQFLIL